MRSGDPYSRFESLQTFLYVSGMTFTFAGGGYFRDQLPKATPVFLEFSILVIYFLIPIAIWATVVYIVLPMIKEERFFRRFILGRRYVEGIWIQWAENPRGLSIIEIQPNAESFSVTGCHYVVSGGQCKLEDAKNFTIEPTGFSWPILRYKYYTRPVTRPGETPESEGLGEYTFSSNPSDGRTPDRFSGTFVYGGISGTVTVDGRKANTQEAQDLRQSNKRDIILKLVAERGWTSAKVEEVASA